MFQQIFFTSTTILSGKGRFVTDMRVRWIFFVAVVFFGFAACSEEELKSDSIIGTWDITWQSDDAILLGEITFGQSKANLKAFGNPESKFLNSYTEISYGYKIVAGNLILYPPNNGNILKYELSSKKPQEWEFNYLEDVTVRILRKSK